LSYGPAIIGVSFGSGEKANKILAQIILDVKKNDERMPAFVQKEISDFLPPDLGCIIIGEEKYLNTYQVILKAKQEAIKRQIKLKYVHLIAHPAHMPRVKMVMHKLELIPLEDPKMPKMPFSKNDPQWWVRSPILFWTREIFASYPYFYLKGWIDLL